MEAFKHGEVVQFNNGNARYKVCDRRDRLELLDQVLQEIGTGVLYPMPNNPLSRLRRIGHLHEATVDEIFGEEIGTIHADSSITFKQKRGEDTMNKTIEKIFAKKPSEDEKLMQKYFGKEIPDNFTGELILEERKLEYLQEAKRLEAAEKKSEEEGGQE
jgi:hypothetical protein